MHPKFLLHSCNLQLVLSYLPVVLEINKRSPSYPSFHPLAYFLLVLSFPIIRLPSKWFLYGLPIPYSL
ncbi:hypothetical protein HanIR_Chr17g0849851 [Helianthus annuus]|nr:hypothetical protein HanIR_Chr17g0849851 [Helianthus annuus]